MTTVFYEVGSLSTIDYDSSDFDTLQEAKLHAIYLDARRREKRQRYASGSLEWNSASGWSSDIVVRRRTCETAPSGLRIINPGSRIVYRESIRFANR